MSRILIIGATSAIAKATARLWACEGHALYLVGRDVDHLHEVADDLRVRGARSVACAALDVNDLARHAEVIDAAASALGRLQLACSGMTAKVATDNCSTPRGERPAGGAGGRASDIAIQAKEILFLRERLNKELSDNTGQPIDKIERDVERDYFMSSEEAKAYGVVDAVISSRPDDTVQAG